MIDNISQTNPSGQNRTMNATQEYLQDKNKQEQEERTNRIEKVEIEARQRVFNQSPEFKKREIVFGQIQMINIRLSNLEDKVTEILDILKAEK